MGHKNVLTNNDNVVPGKACLVTDHFLKPNVSSTSNLCIKDNTHVRQKHIYKGSIEHNGVSKPVTILRDTGSAVHAVHEKFVPADQYLGKTQSVITFSGREEIFDLAWVSVDTQFLSGPIVVCVLRNYPEHFKHFDMIIGNEGMSDFYANSSLLPCSYAKSWN